MKDTKFSGLLLKNKDSNLKISYFHRPGKKGTIIFIHGLGCSKEDFLIATKSKNLKDYEIFAFDWPGVAGSSYPKNKALGINDLVKIIDHIVLKFSLKKVILVGHSLGSVAGLLYSVEYPKRTSGFVSVEGSLVSRNALWSREIKKMGLEVFRNKTLEEMKAGLKKSKFLGFRKYAKTLDLISKKSYFDFSVSHAEICINNYLLNKFLKLKLSKVFIYGKENKGWVPVIKKLKKEHCLVKSIPESHHFSFIDNPDVFYRILAEFTNDAFSRQTLDK